MFLTILVVFFNNNESVCGSLPQQGGLAGMFSCVYSTFSNEGFAAMFQRFRVL